MLSLNLPYSHIQWPCHVGETISYKNTEVKKYRTRKVLGWETALEFLVLMSIGLDINDS